MSTLDAPTAASVEPAGPSPAPPTIGSPLCKAARDPLGAPLCKAARVSEELSIECMLAISFQRSDAGYTLANRPTPVETKEKLLLTDGRERWLVVVFALLFFSFPL